MLTPLEIASGIVLGVERTAKREPGAKDETPLEALENAIRPALERSPCLVSFSGGRDSSAVLVAATHLARRESLPLPIPATNVVRTERGEEREWQELIVEHLGLTEWHRNEVDDELDAVGPVATAVLRRHGLLWPFNVHFHQPLLHAAAGGSLLTGIGGDELFGTVATRLGWRRRGLAFAPARLRSAVHARRVPMQFEWLLPHAQSELARAWGRQAAAEPRRWREQVQWWQRLRYFRIGVASLARTAADDGVAIVHPFAAADVAHALVRASTRGGPTDRTASMQRMFGASIPAELLGRTTKAEFDAVFWNRHSRAFAAGWRGEGADPSVVDVEKLRKVWASPEPIPQTFTQLQAAWLAAERLSG